MKRPESVVGTYANRMVHAPSGQLFIGPHAITSDGGVWHDTPVKAGQPSDPFLAAGFDHKTLHLRHDSAQEVTFTVEVDFLGDQSWAVHSRVKVPAGGYHPLVFPEGYSTEWMRVTADAECRATAHFTYR